MFKHILFQSIALIILLILLYSYAPEFIKEDNLKRIAENKIIQYCYERYPGKDPKYIISGMETRWKNDIKLKKESENFCGIYSQRESLDLL